MCRLAPLLVTIAGGSMVPAAMHTGRRTSRGILLSGLKRI